MKEYKRKKGTVYVLASRPDIDQTAYALKQLEYTKKRAAYFHVLGDWKCPPLQPNIYHYIDLLCSETLSLAEVEKSFKSGLYQWIVIDFIQAMCYLPHKSKIANGIAVLQTMQRVKQLAKQTGVDVIVLSAVKRWFDAQDYPCPKARDILNSYATTFYADAVVTMGLSYKSATICLKQVKGVKIPNLPIQFINKRN